MSNNNKEFNLSVVSSLVLQVRPEVLQEVKDYLENRENIEVHASDDFSKIVIVAEMQNDIELSDFMSEMATVDGVITVNMVFHHTDAPEDLASVNEIPENRTDKPTDIQTSNIEQNESVITFKEAQI